MTPDHHSHRPSMPSRNATARPLGDAAHHSEPPKTPTTLESQNGREGGILPTMSEATSAALEEAESGNESDTSSSGSSSSSSSSSEDDEISDSEVDERRLTLRQRKRRELRPFVGSIFEGKLASFIICDECKNGECAPSRHGCWTQRSILTPGPRDSLAHEGGLYGPVSFAAR